MSGSGTQDDPFALLTREQAAEHWRNGNGETVYVDMSTHMTLGAGSEFSIEDFARPISNAVDGVASGTVVRFESNSAIRIETGAERASAGHVFYQSHGILSDEAFIWGSTSAGFRGNVTVLSSDEVRIEGQIRPFTEQFDFAPNTYNPLLEGARAIGHAATGDGTAYNIVFVGPDGLIVEGTYRLDTFSRNLTPRLTQLDGQCFLAGTPIGLSDDDQSLQSDDPLQGSITTKSIEQIAVGDEVVSYCRDGSLRPGRVTRTFSKEVDCVLDFFGTGMTPGHVTLCGDGEFADQHVPIMDILRTDGAIVKLDGSLVRAATSCEVGSEGDQFVTAIVGDRREDGRFEVRSSGRIRLGTRVFDRNGTDASVLELIELNGGKVTPDGMIMRAGSDQPMPFVWTFGEALPSPEDYVLQRSGLTLSDIYEANEWEGAGPRLPHPDAPVRAFSN